MYAWNPDRFRRADVPGPDPDRGGAGERLAHLRHRLGVPGRRRPAALPAGLGRRGRRRSGPRGNSAFASGRVREVRLTGGLYDSRSQGIQQPELLLRRRARGDVLARRGAVPAAEPAVGPRVEHDADRQPALAALAPRAADAADLGARPPAHHAVRRQPDHRRSASSARTTRSSTSRSSRSSRSGARST